MPPTSRIWICSVALFLGGTALRAQTRPVDSVRWLTGCWERRLVNASQEEHWSDTKGGVMLGFGKVVQRGVVYDYEFVRIYSKGDTLVYEAHPMQQASAEFRAVPPYGYTITFSNPSHDFPQRIIYRRVTADSMVARVEGTRNGQRRGTDFPYKRKACEQ